MLYNNATGSGYRRCEILASQIKCTYIGTVANKFCLVTSSHDSRVCLDCTTYFTHHPPINKGELFIVSWQYCLVNVSLVVQCGSAQKSCCNCLDF